MLHLNISDNIFPARPKPKVTCKMTCDMPFADPVWYYAGLSCDSN